MSFRLILLVGFAAAALTACNNDVFSTKPETRAELPAAPPVVSPQPVPETLPETAPAPITQPEPAPPASPPQANGVDVSDTPVPFTDKLVRGIANGAVLGLKTGQTLSIVLNVNNADGYDWQLEPVGEGLTQYGDYYRVTAPSPGQVNIGGTRYFLFKGDAAGTYPVRIRHTNGSDVRATKSFSIEVTAP
jgi:predicted secreted protein